MRRRAAVDKPFGSAFAGPRRFAVSNSRESLFASQSDWDEGPLELVIDSDETESESELDKFWRRLG